MLAPHATTEAIRTATIEQRHRDRHLATVHRPKAEKTRLAFSFPALRQVFTFRRRLVTSRPAR